MDIAIRIVVDTEMITYTITKEELTQIACDKARECYPNANPIFYMGSPINIKIRGNS